MTYIVLNPGSEFTASKIEPAPRLESLAGKTVGFISNGKEGTKGFFLRLEQLLRDELAVGEVVICQKYNYSAPAETDLIKVAAQWDLAITGIGD